jgi:hypothetical protein
MASKKEATTESKVVKLLRRLKEASADNAEQQVKICEELCRLWEDEHDTWGDVDMIGAIKTLINRMRTPPGNKQPDFYASIGKLLCLMSMGKEENMAAVRNEGGVAQFTYLMENYKEYPLVQGSAWTMLWMITDSTHGLTSPATARMVCSSMAIHVGKIGVQVVGTIFLAHLYTLGTSNKQRRDFVDQDVIPTIMRAVRTYSGVAQMCASGCESLCKMIEKDTDLVSVLWKEGAMSVIVSMISKLMNLPTHHHIPLLATSIETPAHLMKRCCSMIQAMYACQAEPRAAEEGLKVLIRLIDKEKECRKSTDLIRQVCVMCVWACV